MQICDTDRGVPIPSQARTRRGFHHSIDIAKENWDSNEEFINKNLKMGDSAYSFSLTTFSRTGKLLQIEYALNAVANGRTSLGICAKDGVVIATDKKLTSELVDVADVHKVELLTPSCGVCYAGVGPDFRVLGEFDWRNCCRFGGSSLVRRNKIGRKRALKVSSLLQI